MCKTVLLLLGPASEGEGAGARIPTNPPIDVYRMVSTRQLKVSYISV